MMEPQCLEYDPAEHGAVARFLNRIVCSSAFQYGIIVLILLASIVVGLETSAEIMAEYGSLLKTIDLIIIYLFAIEAAMKMGQIGRASCRERVSFNV